MNISINFRSGFVVGNLLGLLMVVFGYIALQNIMERSERVANIDVNQLRYYDLEGNEIALTDYEGKHVLLNFWATWCAPCVKEFPVLEETYKRLNDEFVFVMVSDEPLEKIKAFAEKKPYSFVYAKTNNLLLKGITSVPQSFVLDKAGIKKYHHPTIFEGSSEAIANTLNTWVNK